MARLAALAAAIAVLAAGSGGAAAPASRCAGLSGSFAYIAGHALHVLDLPTCRDRVVVARGASGPVRISHDARFVAFGNASIVRVRGGHVSTPFGAAGASGWVWSPKVDVLAGLTARGGVVVAGPGSPPVRVVPDDWAATSVLWSPRGDALVIGRSRFPRRPLHQEIWLWFPRTHDLQLVAGAFRGIQTPQLATVSRDADWVFWWPRFQNSSSLAADGMPLESKRIAGGARGPRIVRSMLLYPDFITWCRRQLVVAAGGDRYATHGKRLVVARAPLWQPRDLSGQPTRSWASPSCSPGGRLVAAAAGPDFFEARFGREHGRSGCSRSTGAHASA